MNRKDKRAAKELERILDKIYYDLLKDDKELSNKDIKYILHQIIISVSALLNNVSK